MTHFAYHITILLITLQLIPCSQIEPDRDYLPFDRHYQPTGILHSQSMNTGTDHPAVKRFKSETNSMDARVVIEWNQLVLEVAAETDGFQTLYTNRAVPLMHLAIHDALNAIVPAYKSYAFSDINPHAHPVAAASQAARNVMKKIFPDHSQAISELHQRWLGKVPEGAAKKQGVQLGRASAETIIQKKDGDRHDSEGKFNPNDEPGSYRITPPFDEPIGTGWADTEPLAMKSADQFRPGPPPALDSDTYAREFEEVKRLGQKESKHRSDDQTRIGYWFAEYPTVAYPDFSYDLLIENNVHLWSAARLFALLAIDNYDGLISVFDAKYEYNFWRPYTAIRNADLDGNPQTHSDPDWEPEMTTAPHPDYPAALATLCAGGAEVLKNVFGTDDIHYERKSASVLDGMPASRSYGSIDEAVEDCILSRIYNGFHFRTGLETGARMGRQRAVYLLENHLTRQEHTPYPDPARLSDYPGIIRYKIRPNFPHHRLNYLLSFQNYPYL